MNLNIISLNKKKNIDDIKNKLLNGSGLLNLYRQLSEQGRNLKFDFSLNYLENSNLITKQNFFLFIRKKSNLVLGIKILSSIPSNSKINKISFVQNFDFYDDSYENNINFSIQEKTLDSDNNFEMKILDLNILGKNFIYKIEYIDDDDNTKIYENSCIIFEEIKNDEYFQTFFNLLDNENLSDLPFSNNFNFVGIVIGSVIGVGFLGLVLFCYILYKRKNSKNISVKSVKGQITIYNNLEFGSNLNSRELSK